MRKTCILLLVSFAAVGVGGIAAPPSAPPPSGGWKPINFTSMNDTVQELGEWAVAEHVKQWNDGLKFDRVVGGEVQVQAVAGMMKYRLVIELWYVDGDGATYKAEVLEQVTVCTNKRKLVSFLKIGPGPRVSSSPPASPASC